MQINIDNQTTVRILEVGSSKEILQDLVLKNLFINVTI